MCEAERTLAARDASILPLVAPSQEFRAAHTGGERRACARRWSSTAISRPAFPESSRPRYCALARPALGRKHRRRPLVLAERHGQTAARNMLGYGEKFTDVPFFWSQHYDVPINYAGHAEKMGGNRCRRRRREQRLPAALQAQWPGAGRSPRSSVTLKICRPKSRWRRPRQSSLAHGQQGVFETMAEGAGLVSKLL